MTRSNQQTFCDRGITWCATDEGTRRRGACRFLACMRVCRGCSFGPSQSRGLRPKGAAYDETGVTPSQQIPSGLLWSPLVPSDSCPGCFVPL